MASHAVARRAALAARAMVSRAYGTLASKDSLTSIVIPRVMGTPVNSPQRRLRR
jgi:hypothetical protein